MLTEEQQKLLDQIALRDGCYMTEPTERGVVYKTGMGEEILRDEEPAPPSKEEELAALVAQLTERITQLEAGR